MLTPRAYQRVAEVALAALTLIVFTGAAVRLTGSGLGCPDWPKCYGGVAPPLETHAWIEYGNRVISGFVGVAAVAAGALAWRRRPFRRDLARLGVLLPLGVVAQVVLGGFTVRNHLAPGFVMGHFALSMLILVAAASLAWRARYEPGERPRVLDRGSVWAVRLLLPLGALAIFLGTVATAAGPHAGGAGTGDTIDRLEWKGLATLDWAIHQHSRIASVLGVAVVGVYLWLRRRGAPADVLRARRRHRDPDRGPGRGGRDPVRARGARRDRLGARRAGRAHLARAAVVGRRGRAAGGRVSAASSRPRRSG